MKKLIMFLFAAFILSSVNLSYAQTHQELAEQYLSVMKVDEQLKEIYDQMLEVQEQQLNYYLSQSDQVSTEEKEQAIKMQKAVSELVQQELSWQKMKDDYVQLYVEVYTQEDLKELIEFFNSGAGKRMIEKQPDLMQRSMEISQRHAMAIAPKVQSLVQDMMPASESTDSETQSPAESE